MIGLVAVVVGADGLAQAQESVGSGAGRWWLIVVALGSMTLILAAAWVMAFRRTRPPRPQMEAAGDPWLTAAEGAAAGDSHAASPPAEGDAATADRGGVGPSTPPAAATGVSQVSPGDHDS